MINQSYFHIWYNRDTENTRGTTMEKQESFSDIEYGGKKKTTRREKFLQMM